MHNNNTVVSQGGLKMWNRNVRFRKSELVNGLHRKRHS